MIFTIDETMKVDVSTAAQDVDIACRVFLASNAGSSTVYIHPKADGKNATTSDFAIAAGQTINVPMCCEKLSVIGTQAGDLRLMFGHVWG